MQMKNVPFKYSQSGKVLITKSFNYNFQIKLSKTCYNDEVQTVGVAGLPNEIVSSFWSDEPQAVIFVDDAARPTTPGPGTGEIPYKLRNFVVTASSISRLKQTLQNLQAPPWWNHMAPFLIIDQSLPLDQACSNAFKILSMAWKMNLLHGKFICHHESKGSLIYSYNPYTNQAPHSWQLVKTYRVKNEHPWTLLVRGYEDGQKICKDLDFDKTKDLGGYEIRLSSHLLRHYKNWSNTNLESIHSSDGTLLQYLFHKLNSSVKIFVESRNSNYNLTTSGFADMSLDHWFQRNSFNTPMTHPIGSSGLVSLTHYRGHLSQIGKLLHVLDNFSRYAVIIVGLVTFIFFKLLLRQSVTSASLNIVRLTCNSAIVNIPNNVAARIFLSGLFIFSVTLQGIYQGQLASLLTKQVNLPNVDTLENLENLNYTIYCNKDVTPYLETLNYSGRIVSVEDLHCEKYVLEDAGAASVRGLLPLIDIAEKYDLHISSDYLMQSFLVYVMRKDWAVEEELNTLISRLFEANISQGVFSKKVDSATRRNEYKKKEQGKKKFEVITLKELAFAFAILGIGLTCSSVVFIVEIFLQ